MMPAAVGGPSPCSLRCARRGIPQRRTPNRRSDLARGGGIVGGIRIAGTRLPSLRTWCVVGGWGSGCSADAGWWVVGRTIRFLGGEKWRSALGAERLLASSHSLDASSLSAPNATDRRAVAQSPPCFGAESPCCAAESPCFGAGSPCCGAGSPCCGAESLCCGAESAAGHGGTMSRLVARVPPAQGSGSDSDSTKRARAVHSES